jgi:uncharacterized membrane protein
MRQQAYVRLQMVLSATGLGVAGYLTLLHYDRRIPLVCSGGSLVNCAQVLSSPSSVVLGVPVAAWGLLWFAVALSLAILSGRPRDGDQSPGLRSAGVAWATLGTLTVLWLIYQEVGVIGRICVWCTVVHGLVLALLVIQVLAAPVRAAGSAGHR